MRPVLWFIIFGAVFMFMGLSVSLVKRLPLTTSLLYLAIGGLLGPQALGFFALDPVKDAALLERATEIVVIISLFSAGLKLRLPWRSPEWRIALRLAFGSMVLTVALISLLGVFALGLPAGAAVLLGAILAPTDPVLASDVQVRGPSDQDQLRFSLTSEAGLNDGTAFPFVMLGLGLLGLHELGAAGWRWLVADVLWAICGGLLIGAVLGTGVSRLVVHLRSRHKETVILDDFLALGLIALSYGLALLLGTYGFLAVFAAGLALRRTERKSAGQEAPTEVKELAALGRQEGATFASPEKASAYTAQAVLLFNEQLERLGEVALVLLLGGMLWVTPPAIGDAWFVAALLLVIRPAAVLAGLARSPLAGRQIRLISWFGIRGIGSLYYLAYAIEQGLPPELALKLSQLVIATVAVSIVIHGISVTPLMEAYGRKSSPETG